MTVRIALGSFMFAVVLLQAASLGGPAPMFAVGVLLSWPLAWFVLWKPAWRELVPTTSFQVLLFLGVVAYALALIVVAYAFGLPGILAFAALSIVGFTLPLTRRLSRR